MTQDELLYQQTLENGLGALCAAMGVDSEKYDTDQADTDCYADCFRNAAELIQKLKKESVEEDRAHGRTIDQRDHWVSKATELAEAIGKALGFDVGEHSSANCPVQNAIDGVFEMGSQIEEWRSSEA